MYNGIIYRYFLVNDKGKEKSYVGQTCSEKKRRQDFLNINVQYGGSRIENARQKYKPENFKYEILEEINEKSVEERNTRLNEREKYYIELFDSFKHGYNNTIGGGGANGYEHTEEYKKWQSEKTKELVKNPKYIQKISSGIVNYYENDPNARIKKSEEVRKRYEDPVEREKTSRAHKQSHANNPDRAKKQAEKLSETCSTLEGRKRMSDTIKNAWKTVEYREKYSKSKKELWNTSEYRAKMAEAHKGMNGKRVIQLTLEGVPIMEYESTAEAARQLGFSFGGIARVCRGERTHYKGYKWTYKNN